MPDPRPSHRLPGNRVIRRRQNATKVIAVSDRQERRDVPSVQGNAQKFAASFIVIVLLGAALLSRPFVTESGESTPFIDAFFTAMSAGSVTGLVVVDTQDHWNFWGELIVLLLVQIGGLGFMVGASLVLASLRRSASLRDSLLIQDGSPTLTLQEAADLSRRIARFIFTVEAIGAALLSARFLADMEPHVAVWYGIYHSVTAFCNAGFDLFGGFRSLTGYDASPWINLVIGGLIQAGSLSYMVFSDVWKKRRWTHLALDTKLVLLTNAILLAGGAVLFTTLEWGSSLAHTPEWARPMAGLFQSTAARAAGYASVPLNEMQDPTLFFWVALMGIGGAAGSTAGGIKLATIAVVAIAVGSTIRGQPEAQAFGRRIAPAIVFRAMAIIALFLTAFFLITLCLGITENVLGDHEFRFLDLMLETMSALATVGLSTGVTPNLTDGGKLLMLVAMLFGRLGPLTAVYALQRRSRPARYRYPEATIRLG